jgi:murein L,D-transpeptidase YafK
LKAGTSHPRRAPCRRLLLLLLWLAAAGLSAAAGEARAATLEARAAPAIADQVLVLKSARRLLLLRDDRVLHSFAIALGRNPVGAKERQGDGRTPEGRYRLDWRNPQSRFYRSIHISYPDGEDRARARDLGVSPGGAIMIHGLPNGLAEIGADHARFDWTDGCIAVTNEEMDVIWRSIENGTPIVIRP